MERGRERVSLLVPMATASDCKLSMCPAYTQHLAIAAARDSQFFPTRIADLPMFWNDMANVCPLYARYGPMRQGSCPWLFVSVAEQRVERLEAVSCCWRIFFYSAAVA